MGANKLKGNKRAKKRNRLIYRTVILAILIVAVVYAIVANLRDEKAIYDEGDMAPDFKLQQINENNELKSIQLSDLKGKGVMLNFWATFCKPCEAEMPYMEKLYPEYKDKGIEIVAVSLDSTELVVDRFIDKYNLTFPIPFDVKDQVRELYNVGPIPSTLFINSEGKIVKKVEGALTLEKLEGYLQQIEPKK